MEAAERSKRPDSTSRPRRVLLLINPASRRGASLASTAARLLEQQGLQVEAGNAASREEVGSLIEGAADGVDAVVVGGGDGSINAVLPALLRTGLPLGVLPLGTANDFARTLGLPVDLASAVRVIAEGATCGVDVGVVNGHPFLNVASLGLSTDLAQRLTGVGKRRWGRLSYAAAALAVLARARPFRAVIVAGGQAVRVQTYQIAVGNGRYYGGGLPVRHDASIGDGRLDLYSLEFKAVGSLLLAGLAFRRGRQGAWREVRELQCTRFQVRTRRPRPVNLDGELLTLTPARFDLLPQALAVYAPAPAAKRPASFRWSLRAPPNG
jgi:YegS/Rv2252/BmrU family lipid kinase